MALDSTTAQILREHRRGKPMERPLFDRPKLDTLKADCRRAGIAIVDARGRSIGFHAFRRFVPTALDRLKVSAETARQQLGHANISTTLNHYTDTGLQQQSEAVSLLASAIYDATVGPWGLPDARPAGPNGLPVDTGPRTSHHLAATPMPRHTHPSGPTEAELANGTQASQPALASSASGGPITLSLVGSSQPARSAKRTGASRQTRASGVEPDAPAAPAASMTIGHRTIRLEVGPGTEALLHRVLDLVEHAIGLETQGSAPGAVRVEPSNRG